MSQRELDELAQMSGVPSGCKITTEMAKAAAESMAKMSPADLENAAAQYVAHHKSDKAPSTTHLPSADAERGVPDEAMASLARPEMLQQMAEVMGSMSEEQMEAMVGQ